MTFMGHRTESLQAQASKQTQWILQVLEFERKIKGEVEHSRGESQRVQREQYRNKHMDLKISEWK